MAANADLSEFNHLAYESRAGKKKPCNVRRLLDTLDEADRVNLVAALALTQDEMPAAAIMAWAARRDFDLSATAVGLHRRGKCTCGGLRDD